MDTQSPSERHPFGVMPVTRSIMASSTLVSHASLNLMFNVVWSQKSLLIKVISTDLSSPLQALDRVAIVMVIEEIQYSVVPLVNLHSTLNVRDYHKPQGTNNMSIPSLSIIQLKMTLVNIIMISVKKNETQTIGSTIVQITLMLHVLNVFLENIQI